MTRYGTPEEAARGDIPPQFVRVIGVVVRGDDAVVAHEVDTAYCHRDGEGWVAGSSGNSTSGFLLTSKGVATVVVWDEAPADAVAARFEYAGREQVVAVENCCAFAVFDEVAEDDAWLGGPRLAAWVDARGTEQELPRFEPSAWLRARLREYRQE